MHHKCSIIAGIDFLKSYVACSAVVPEFQGHHGNSSIITVISFSETRRRHKGPNQVIKDGGRPQLFVQQTKIPALMEYAGALLWCMNQLFFCHCSSRSWWSDSSDITEPPSSNFGYLFGLEEQIFYVSALKVTCVGIL